MPPAYVVLLAGAVVALYILLGYPLLLALVPFKQAPRVRKDLSHQMTVSVILAVYNGAAHIRAKLETLPTNRATPPMAMM